MNNELSRSLKHIGWVLLIGLVFSCNSNDEVRLAPYKFPIEHFDSLVRSKQVILDQTLREDGSLKERRYYLADTVKFIMEYNRQGELMSVVKFDKSGKELWQENYFPSGQRMAHYDKFVNEKTGVSEFHGNYKAYYESGYLKEKGVYEHDMQKWVITYDQEGNSGDTIVYEMPK